MDDQRVLYRTGGRVMKPSEKTPRLSNCPMGHTFHFGQRVILTLAPGVSFGPSLSDMSCLKTWYRVFRVGKTPGDWLPMQPGDAVLEQTGFGDDPDILAEPVGPQLGAAEKLKRGRYVLQAKCRIVRKMWSWLA